MDEITLLKYRITALELHQNKLDKFVSTWCDVVEELSEYMDSSVVPEKLIQAVKEYKEVFNS